jgi:hypothetical protein
MEKMMDREDSNKYRFLARLAKKNYSEQFFKQRNIVGMAFGRKIVHHQATDEPSVVIYVMKKVSKNFLSPSKILPRRIYIGGDWINVDVIETGPFSPLAFTARERPAPSGISIGHFNITAGTLGCLVTDLTDGSRCILSNNHVMADENAASLGDNILQPGPADGGLNPADALATLKRFVMINATGNVIDAAIAQPIKSADVVNQMKDNLMPVPSSDHPAVGLLFAGSCNRTLMNPIRQVLSGLNIDLVNTKATVEAEVGMNVEKVGRTTEYTTSTITEIDVTVSVGYDFGSATFDEQIATAWMSDGGDSGSIVCRGGDGGSEDHCGCGSTSAAAALLQRDVTIDVAAEKMFREKYLSNTLTGRYLLDSYFRNEDYILERVKKIRTNKEDVDYIQHLYDKYAEEFRAMALNPRDSKQRITAEHLKEAARTLGRFSQYLQKDEQEAAKQLFEIVQSFEGKTVSDALEILDDRKVYNNVVKILSKVDTLKKDDCCR